MQNLHFTIHEKNTNEFLYTGLKIDLKWVVAFISSNKIKKNSIKIILDSNIIKGSPIERYCSKKYDLFLKQTTLLDVLNSESPFFKFGRGLIINRKYASSFVYRADYKITFDNIILDTPKWSRRKILKILTVNSS